MCGKAGLRRGAASLGIQRTGGLDGLSHLPRVGDEEPGAAVFDDFGQRAGAEGDDRCSAGESFHGDQRTGFGGEARHEQAAGGG